MRTITQIIENNQLLNSSLPPASVQLSEKNASNNAETQKTEGLSTKTLSWLWLAMQGLYPTKWNAAMGQIADDSGVLSVQARMWKRGLSGVSSNEIMKAVDYLTDNHSPFIPDLGEFKALCIQKNCPTIEQVIRIIANSVPTEGSIAKRYKHPLVLAVAKSEGFDAWLFKTATIKQCTDMIRPIYARLMQNGWDDFLPEHFEQQAAIEKPLKQTSGLGLSALSALKAELNFDYSR